MLKPFEIIRSALPYLKNLEVKTAFDKMLRQLNRDLEDVGYTSSSTLDLVLKDFEELINEIDEKKSEIRELQKRVEAEMEDDDEE